MTAQSQRIPRDKWERDDFVWNSLYPKAANGDQAARNVLDMIDEGSVDPYDNYTLLELYDASR